MASIIVQRLRRSRWRRQCRLLLAAALVLVVRGRTGGAGRRLLRLLSRLLLQRFLVPTSKDPTSRIRRGSAGTNRDSVVSDTEQIKQET
jgi:hypothetical protein